MTTTKRPRPRTSSKSSPARIAAARRAARALDLRAAGLTFKEIARRLCYRGRQGAADAVARGLDATLRPAADAVRTLDLMRLDKLLAAHFKRACAGDHDSTLICLRVMERRARLLGLDAPIRTASRQQHSFAGGVLVVPGLMPGSE